jgi:quercetin dioxygenase-like cupin family protein
MTDSRDVRTQQMASAKNLAMGALTLRPFAGDKLMVVRIEAPEGSLAPMHSHPHEQMSLVISGRVSFRLLGQERVLGAGEVVHLPSGVEHEARFLESTVMYDIFSPVRDDFRLK